MVKINFPKINKFDQTKVVLQALEDTGCSFTSICKSVVPQHNCFRSNIITKTITMSRDIKLMIQKLEISPSNYLQIVIFLATKFL